MRINSLSIALLARFVLRHVQAELLTSGGSEGSSSSSDGGMNEKNPAAQRWLLHWQLNHRGTKQYREPNLDEASALGASRIPRIILMTVASVDEALTNYGHLMEQWWLRNPEYAYVLLSDADCEAFLQACCSIEERTAYAVLKTGPSRADLFRAIWMRDIGGVYVDQDSILTKPLRDVIPASAPLVTHKPSRSQGKSVPGWNFNFLAFQPRCPIWQVQVRRVVARVLEQANFACHRDARGCRGFYACVQNVTGSRPFRQTVLEVTQRYGCRGMHDCVDAHHEQFRNMVVLGDEQMPMKHQPCHAKKGMRRPCKRPNETKLHYVSLPAASAKYYLTFEGKRDGSSAPAYFRAQCAEKE